MMLRRRTLLISTAAAAMLLVIFQAMLRLVYGREQGEAFVLSAIVAAACPLCCLLIAQLMERTVRARLAGLDKSIRQIKGGEGERLSISDDDEIATLAGTVNKLLDALQEADRELELSENRYQSLLAGLPVGVCRISTGPDSRFINFNPAVTRMFAAGSRDGMMKARPVDLLADKRDVTRLWSRLRRHGEISQVEIPLTRMDGTVFWARVSARIVRTERASPDDLDVCIENISDLRDAQAALEQAERASRAKSESLANMSHEIRTPLTSILGYADLLMDADQSPSERLNCLHTIRRNGEHLLSILNDILDLSKIEAGCMLLDVIACSPHEIASEVDLLLRRRMTDKNLSLETRYNGPIPRTIRTDPTRLRQILINLVGNAIKFTRSGEVRIEMGMATAPNDPKPQLSFSVIDTGIGMSPEQVQRLFRPFVQAEASTTRHFGGTGLGLTISKRLAEALGGQITVQSTPGRGSTFTVTVATGPLDDVEMVEIEPTSTESDIGSISLSVPKTLRLAGRVLLAEDGLDNQHLVTCLLKKVGLSVTVCDNGKLACEQAQEALAAGDPFDLILMDMQMPVMNGYEATAELRSQGYRGPIVALTASAMRSDREECGRIGCDDFLSKPIERAHLIRTVARYTRPSLDEPDTSAAPVGGGHQATLLRT
jgi:Amt family ammonium transporter